MPDPNPTVDAHPPATQPPDDAFQGPKPPPTPVPQHRNSQPPPPDAPPPEHLDEGALFGMADADGDGSVSTDEMEAFLAQHGDLLSQFGQSV